MSNDVCSADYQQDVCSADYQQDVCSADYPLYLQLYPYLNDNARINLACTCIAANRGYQVYLEKYIKSHAGQLTLNIQQVKLLDWLCENMIPGKILSCADCQWASVPLIMYEMLIRRLARSDHRPRDVCFADYAFVIVDSVRIRNWINIAQTYYNCDNTAKGPIILAQSPATNNYHYVRNNGSIAGKIIVCADDCFITKFSEDAKYIVVAYNAVSSLNYLCPPYAQSSAVLFINDVTEPDVNVLQSSIARSIKSLPAITHNIHRADIHRDDIHRADNHVIELLGAIPDKYIAVVADKNIIAQLKTTFSRPVYNYRQASSSTYTAFKQSGGLLCTDLKSIIQHSPNLNDCSRMVIIQKSTKPAIQLQHCVRLIYQEFNINRAINVDFVIPAKNPMMWLKCKYSAIIKAATFDAGFDDTIRDIILPQLKAQLLKRGAANICELRKYKSIYDIPDTELIAQYRAAKK
jgi:hypothetical protein